MGQQTSRIQSNDNTKINKQTNTLTAIIKGLLLLTLAVSGNYIGEMLGCKVQYLLTTNGYAKNIVLGFIIYFTLTLFNDTIVHPLNTLKYTLILFISFKLFTKTHSPVSIVIFLLLALIYILSNFIEYYLENNKNNENNEKVKLIKKSQTGILVIIIVLTLASSSYYLYDKYNEYKDTKKGFSFVKFYFTAIKCDSLKGL